jgi:hypothetical protein
LMPSFDIFPFCKKIKQTFFLAIKIQYKNITKKLGRWNIFLLYCLLSFSFHFHIPYKCCFNKCKLLQNWFKLNLILYLLKKLSLLTLNATDCFQRWIGKYLCSLMPGS